MNHPPIRPPIVLVLHSREMTEHMQDETIPGGHLKPSADHVISRRNLRVRRHPKRWGLMQA